MAAVAVVGLDPVGVRIVGEGLAGGPVRRGSPVLLTPTEPGGELVSLPVDPRDEGALASAIAHAATELGPVMAVVALPTAVREGPLHELDEERWRSAVDANLTLAMHVARGAAPAIARAGGGALAFVTWRPEPGAGRAHVAAVSGAVGMLARALAVELADAGVRANAVTVPPPDVAAAIPALRLLGTSGAGYVTGESIDVGEPFDARRGSPA